MEGKTANGVKCGTFAASSSEDRHIATGDHAGKLVIYDLENIDKPIFEQQAHTSIINAIDGCGGLDTGFGAPEIVTGGRDGCVRLWDQRVEEPVLALEPSEGQSARDCWTVAFGNSYSDEDRCIVAGYDNGDVKLFDLRTNTMRYETNVANGVTCIEFDRCVCTLIHSYTHTLIHSYTHTLVHSYTHTLYTIQVLMSSVPSPPLPPNSYQYGQLLQTPFQLL